MPSKLLPLPKPITIELTWDEIAEWTQYRLDGPFTKQDNENGLSWVATKLIHQTPEVPEAPAFWLTLDDDFFDHDLRQRLLRLCPFDDLIAAIKALAPIGKGERMVPIDSDSICTLRDLQNALATIDVEAVRLVRGLLTEFEHRHRLTDEQYREERDEVWAQFERRCAQLKRRPRKLSQRRRHHE